MHESLHKEARDRGREVCNVLKIKLSQILVLDLTIDFRFDTFGTTTIFFLISVFDQKILLILKMLQSFPLFIKKQIHAFYV